MCVINMLHLPHERALDPGTCEKWGMGIIIDKEAERKWKKCGEKEFV